jgi:hypothetical protein
VGTASYSAGNVREVNNATLSRRIILNISPGPPQCRALNYFRRPRKCELQLSERAAEARVALHLSARISPIDAVAALKDENECTKIRAYAAIDEKLGARHPHVGASDWRCGPRLKGSRSRPSLRVVRVSILHSRLLTFQQHGGR